MDVIDVQLSERESHLQRIAERLQLCFSTFQKTISLKNEELSALRSELQQQKLEFKSAYSDHISALEQENVLLKKQLQQQKEEETEKVVALEAELDTLKVMDHDACKKEIDSLRRRLASSDQKLSKLQWDHEELCNSSEHGHISAKSLLAEENSVVIPLVTEPPPPPPPAAAAAKSTSAFDTEESEALRKQIAELELQIANTPS